MRATALFVFLCACGGGTPAVPVATGPLSAEDAVFYDNGIDFVADPEALEGQWRRDWSRELDARVSTADLLAVVRVVTMRTDSDPSRRVTYRLVVEGLQEIVGEITENLSLRVLHSDAGFNTVDGNDRRILDQRFILFAKYEIAEGDTRVRARWHMSPAAEDVVARVEYLAERRRGVERERPNTTVVVHQHE